MKFNKITFIPVFLLSFCLISANVFAQDDEETEEVNYRPVLKLSYLKKTDNTKVLTCNISSRVDGNWLKIENAEIKFYAGTDSLIELGTKTSDAQGTAILEIGKDDKLPVDADGSVTYSVEYEGVENSSSRSTDLTIYDVQLDMSLEVIDSVKTIVVKATKKDSIGEDVPVGDESVNIYVKRLYSNLKVGEVYLEEGAGEGSLAFREIPGDSVGNVEIIARFDDHDDFGYVEVRKTVQWGTPVSYAIKKPTHEIWSNVAPVWMTVTVIIFVLGVLYHLVLIFIRMWKIKKIGKDVS